jgi:molybdate/tungstate transport system substrate-binding protein
MDHRRRREAPKPPPLPPAAGFSRRAFLAAASACAASACSKPRDLIVFHAASLRRYFADLAAELGSQSPRVQVHLESSGSQVAIRKIVEQGMRADLVAVADARLLDTMLIPTRAAWNLVFATNELVLAHMAHSKYTEEVDAKSWPEILLRPGVKLGRVDPNHAPLGYHTLFLWQLAQRSGGFGPLSDGLEGKLLQAASKEKIASDESELLSMLEAKAVDYAFLYRSTAEDHHLKSVLLPSELNLSSPSLASAYAQASVEVRMKQGSGTGSSVLRGGPITYGLAIPLNAPNPRDAERFAAFLLGERGLQIGRRAGFRPLAPALTGQLAALPPVLRSFAAPAPGAAAP